LEIKIMTSNVKKIAIATTGVALGLTAIDAAPVEAAIITYDFLVETNSQSFPGFFSYNDVDPAENLGYGLEIPVTDFEWEFLGVTYTDENVGRRIRREFPNPLGVGVIVQPADFYLGQPFNPYRTLPGLNFGVVIEPPFGTRIEGNQFSSAPPFTEGTVTYTLRSVEPPVTSVLEPTNVAGLSLLGLGLLLKKKKTSQNS
jgi:hypothetical protein